MIPSKVIRDYLMTKFSTDYRLESDETELIIPSIFVANDYKRHMNINLDSGLWRCFKTGEKGNFLTLYSKLEGISYAKAYEKFLFDIILNEDKDENTQVKPPNVHNLNEVLNTFLPVNSGEYYHDAFRSEVWGYLHNRKLFDGYNDMTFYAGTEGSYKGRLIIPFHRLDGSIFHFQARALHHSQQPKYLNWKGFKASQVLYPFEFNKDTLYVCEGVIDALSLKKIGVNATTPMSCHISLNQGQLLKEFQGKVVIAFDSDSAGIKGGKSFNALRKHLRMDNCYYIYPPIGCKDWNEALVKNKLNSDSLSNMIKFDSIDDIFTSPLNTSADYK